MAQPDIKMVVGCYAALVGPGMRCGFGIGCGGAEETAVGKLLRPLKYNNRFRHLSIIASNRSSTSRSSNKQTTVAVLPISTNSYISPSSFRASSLAARIAASRSAASFSSLGSTVEKKVSGTFHFDLIAE